jgi:UDP-glucose 4-epimerase
MNILVTGGLGFVGHHLTKRLVADGHNVLVMDNLSVGKISNKTEGSTYTIWENKDIDCFGFIPDIVYHLGEYSRVMTSFEDIEKVVEYNVKGTIAVIDFCRKHKIKLVYAGSSTRFGDAESPYSFFKKQNAEIIKKYGKWFGLDYAIAYFYNVYGSGQISKGKYATLIGILEENRKKKLPNKINKPGTQKRIFTHIDDVVDGLILIGERGHGEYCLGSQEEYSVLQVAKMFGGKIEMQEAKRGDRNYSKIDLDRIEKLGWKAKKSLRTYIKNVLSKKIKEVCRD